MTLNLLFPWCKTIYVFAYQRRNVTPWALVNTSEQHNSDWFILRKHEIQPIEMNVTLVNTGIVAP